MNRRSVLKYGGLGLGGLLVGGVVHRRRSGRTEVVSDGDNTSVHDGDEDEPGKPEGGDAIEIDLEREADGVNSDSVTFVHGAFTVCNRGKDETSIWVDADPIENARGEASVRFYRELGERIDDPSAAVDLAPKECLPVGVMTRTFGLSADGPLVDKVVVRSDRDAHR